jgi:acyl carrier protein
MTRDNAADEADLRSVESMVAGIFREVLELSDVPADASFVALGGTSLDACRLCALVSDRLDVAMSLSSFLDQPTVHAVTRIVAGWAGQEESSAPLPATPPGPLRTPLTPVQLEILLQGLMHGGQRTGHCMAWRMSGNVQPQALRAATQDLHERHESLRACYRIDDIPYASPAGGPATVDWQLATATPAHATAVLSERLTAPLEPATGHVWRAVLVDAQEYWLLGVSVDHVAFDGWSGAILAVDLEIAYAARLAGQAPSFPAPAPSVAEANAEFTRQLASANLGGQRQYWMNELDGLPVLPSRFGHRDHADEVSLQGRQDGYAHVDVPLPADLMASCSAAAQQHSATLFVVLLACYFDAFRRVSGIADFAVGTPIARRTGSVTSRAISCMTGMTCFRLRPRSSASPDRYLAACRDKVMEVMAALDVSVPELARLLRVRPSERGVFYQTVFALQDIQESRLSVPGAIAEPEHLIWAEPPAELIAEVFPAPSGAAFARLRFSLAAVSPRFAHDLGHEFESCLRALNDSDQTSFAAR